MQIGNWLTRSFFLRYAIADERDIDDAVQKLEPASRAKNRQKLTFRRPRGVTGDRSWHLVNSILKGLLVPGGGVEPPRGVNLGGF